MIIICNACRLIEKVDMYYYTTDIESEVERRPFVREKQDTYAQNVRLRFLYWKYTNVFDLYLNTPTEFILIAICNACAHRAKYLFVHIKRRETSQSTQQ